MFAQSSELDVNNAHGSERERRSDNSVVRIVARILCVILLLCSPFSDENVVCVSHCMRREEIRVRLATFHIPPEASEKEDER